MASLGKFQFCENWPHGLQLFVTSEPLIASMASEGEIEVQIKALKSDLDAAAKQMKEALSKRPASMFDQGVADA